MHSEMGLVWQNPIQRTVKTAHLSVLMTVHSFSTQCYVLRRLPQKSFKSYISLQYIIIAPPWQLQGLLRKHIFTYLLKLKWWQRLWWWWWQHQHDSYLAPRTCCCMLGSGTPSSCSSRSTRLDLYATLINIVNTSLMTSVTGPGPTDCGSSISRPLLRYGPVKQR